MSSSRPHRRYAHTDLFLVRIWTDVANSDACEVVGEDGDRGGASNSELEWQGTVQRTVDGEAYQFSSWQGLQDLLLAMISNNKRRQK